MTTVSPTNQRIWQTPTVSELSPAETSAVQAVVFLERFHPETMWALCSFGRNNEVGPARTFHPSEALEAMLFIEKMHGWNLYFHVNEIATRLSRKAKKRDIVAIHWLHADVDLDKKIAWSNPSAVEIEKSRVLAMVRAYEPPPTVVTWSGGGFQAFWRLSAPIIVNGDVNRMRSAERRIERIERGFNADACHNADRLMRLPGTLNILSKTKIAAGREAAVSAVVEFHDGRTWDIADFPELESEARRTNVLDAPRAVACHPAEGREMDRIRDALRAIPADEYGVYLRILMSIKAELGDAGLSLAREWALSSAKFDESEFARKWKSIRREGGVTVASLFALARDHGWREGQCNMNGVITSDSLEPDMRIIQRNWIAIPSFPVDVFGPAAKWVLDTAESKSAPIDYVALGLLTVASGMIGAKRRVSPWAGWEEPSILWGALVGEPSSRKSPAVDPMRDAVRAIETRLNADWQDRQAEYVSDAEIAATWRKDWEREVKEAVENDTRPPPMPPEAIMPMAPTRHRCWIAESTTEQIARILGENPVGVICFRDELAGLLGGFDRYSGSGSDRAFWLEAYGGRPHRFDRVGFKGGCNDISSCAVSLLGSIQPDRLAKMLLSGDDDGMAARVLFAWPDPVPPRRPTRAPDDRPLDAALSRLRELDFDTSLDGTPRARVVSLASEASQEFENWWKGRHMQATSSASGKLAGAVGKLEGTALRLSQTLEFLQWAWGSNNDPEPKEISLHNIRNALRIVDEWVRPNLDRVFSEASLPEPQRDAMILGRWILKKKPASFNARDLRRLPGFQGAKDSKRLDAAIEILVEAHWLTAAASGAIGRPRKDYFVNPAIYRTP